jgi:type I restriction enzyme, S subunit
VSRWPMVAIGEVADPVVRSEAPLPGVAYRQIGVHLWGGGAFERESIDGADTKYKTLNRVKAGDLIVNKIWARNGSVSVVTPSLEGCFCSGEFPLFRPRPERLDPQWFYWITKTRWFWEACDRQSRGTSGKNRLRPQRFLEITIPLAPIEEQRRVVEKLDRLATQSARLGSLQGHVEGAADALLRARLNGLFGDPYRGVAGSAGFTDFASIGELSSDVADGPHVTPQYVDDGVPFVTVLNITSGRVDFNRAKHITSAAHELYSKRAKAEPGDVLISKDGTLGVPCYVDTEREFSFFVSVALVKPRRDLLDGRFLTWALRAPHSQDRIAERSRGDMIRHLVLREIRQLLVPVVSLADQQRIVSELDATEHQHKSLVARMRQSQGIAMAISGSVSASALAGS